MDTNDYAKVHDMTQTKLIPSINVSDPLPELANLCDMEQGRMSGEVFVNKEIYRQEMEKIFSRCWLFVAHESQLPKPNDFITTTMGEDGVIAVRQEDESIKVFLNQCTHRGNKICFAEAGSAKVFTCNYHGWCFGSDGSMRGMHEAAVYQEDGFDKSKWGLREVAQVASYRGLVFATFDPAAPSLDDYLGPMKWYMDALFNNQEGGVEFVGGCTRSVLECNWKLPAENFVGDIMHGGWTHAAGGQAMGVPIGRVSDLEESYQVNWNGHGYEFAQDTVGNAAILGESAINKYLHTIKPSVIDRLGQFRANMIGAVCSATIFPNMSFLAGQNIVRVWQPRGPNKIEMYSWVVVNKSAPQEIKDKWRHGAMMTFSPTGTFEMDDGENWEFCTKTSEGSMSSKQDLYLGLGTSSQISDTNLPGNVHKGQLNEANQRAYYQQWQDHLNAKSWAELPNRNTGNIE